ncbi:hypothetical protein D9757_008945 [Collybiopsis confluens]|uniref:Uncharacterized protein n=1 Tax=Collybiopsis confluens TaxID=2823264 RepID=A0A8H5HFD8_9AGAR|nr:hypothetical protein D9757_008945 [Collybiopsis confluens]
MANRKLVAVVIGASRGIGAEFVKQLHEDEYCVIATVRKSVDVHVQGASMVVDAVELESTESMTKAAQKVPEADLLIINASMGEDETMITTDSNRLNHYLDLNVTGTHRAIQAFLPALRARKTRKIVVLATYCGSFYHAIHEPIPTFNGPYAVSKAALHMLAVQYHKELSKEGFTVLPIDPGWVDTDMGRLAGDPIQEGGNPPEISIKGMLEAINSVKPDDEIRIIDYSGTVIPW